MTCMFMVPKAATATVAANKRDIVMLVSTEIRFNDMLAEVIIRLNMSNKAVSILMSQCECDFIAYR